MKRARTAAGKVYDVEVHGKTRRVTVPEDPKPEDMLNDALRENLSPHAVAAIAAFCQTATTQRADVDRQIRWFADRLIELVGGGDEHNRLCEEAGL